MEPRKLGPTQGHATVVMCRSFRTTRTKSLDLWRFPSTTRTKDRFWRDFHWWRRKAWSETNGDLARGAYCVGAIIDDASISMVSLSFSFLCIEAKERLNEMVMYVSSLHEISWPSGIDPFLFSLFISPTHFCSRKALCL